MAGLSFGVVMAKLVLCTVTSIVHRQCRLQSLTTWIDELVADVPPPTKRVWRAEGGQRH